MINRRVLAALKSKTRLKGTGIYSLIQAKRRQLNFAVSKEEAALLLAGERDIDISKLATEKEIASIRPFAARPALAPNPASPPSKGTIRMSVTEVALPSGALVSSPFLSPGQITDARRMSLVYIYLYLFENTIRSLVREVLEKRYGPDWWSTRVSVDPKRYAEERIALERKHKWHGARGAHPLYYINIGHLVSIIRSNWTDLEPYIGQSLEWVRTRIEEIELSRNTVAHNNPLSDRDCQRVKIYFGDWIRQVQEPTVK